ncbi:hypothetical protein GCM10027570_52240 [Streptomonospora sediminis]
MSARAGSHPAAEPASTDLPTVEPFTAEPPAAFTGPTAGAGTRRPALRRAVTVAAALAGSLALWAVAVLAGAEPTAYQGGAIATVGSVPIAVASFAAALAAWALLAVLERTVRRPGLTWTAVAAAVLVLSLLGPVFSAAGTASMLVLLGLHAVPGAVVIAGMAPTAQRPSR